MLGLDNPLHILLVLVVVLLVFGAKRLPEMGKSLGEGIRGFKSSIEHPDHSSEESSVHPMSSLEPVPAPVQKPASNAARTPQSVVSADADRTPQPLA